MLFIKFPDGSITPVVTMILYVVKAIKLDEGVTEKVWFELDTVGDADICTQLLKLSDDT